MPRNQGPWPVFRYACFGDWTYYAGCYYALLRAVASIGLVELVVNVKMVRGIPSARMSLSHGRCLRGSGDQRS